jgi:hypothetical protein
MTKERKNLLVFGYGVALIAFVFAWRLYAKHGWGYGSTVAAIVAVIFLSLTIFSLPLLKKVYDRWMKVAGFISMIVTTVILTILFFLVFGVVGIILRILKKDLLELRTNPDVKTYWKVRQKVYNKEDYLRQF